MADEDKSKTTASKTRAGDAASKPGDGEKSTPTASAPTTTTPGFHGGNVVQPVSNVQVMQPGSVLFINTQQQKPGQPQNVREWSSGLCGCFEDCSTCEE